jgi:putative Holliday junction resolvase
VTPKHALPLDGRLLGVDLGEVRVGIAVSDPAQMIAHAVETCPVARNDFAAMLDVVKAAVDTHEPVGVVVGHPRQLDGRDGPKGAWARRFAQALEQAIDRPVVLVDERFSTVEAERVLIEADLSRKKRKTVIDAVAATVVLQHALEKQRLRRTTDNPS